MMRVIAGAGPGDPWQDAARIAGACLPPTPARPSIVSSIASVVPSLSLARTGTATMFLLMGLAVGLWVVHIPVLQRQLSLSDGQLGLALFAIVGGAMASMPLTGFVATTRGSGLATRLLSMLLCVGFALPLAAPDLPLLVVACALLGMGMGGLDVAMNAQAVEVERRLSRPIMSSMHAFFSLGGLIGSIAGAGLLTMPWSGATTMAVAAGMMALVAVPAGRWLLAERRPPREQREHLGAADILRPRLLAIGVLAFCGLFAEGAVGDWSSLFLTRQTGASPAAAATGFAAFSVTMTLARFAGDRAVARIGARRSLVIGGLLAFAGMTLALAIPQLWVGVIGFALMGLGFANMVPVLFSAAGRAGATPQAGIAVVTMIAYAGSLLGPPLIGGLSEHVGLPQALSLVAAFGLLVALGARAIPES